MTRNWLDFDDLDLIFKVTAVEKEKKKIHGGHLLSLKTVTWLSYLTS